MLLSYLFYFAFILPFCCINQKSLNIYLLVFVAFSLSKVTCQHLLLLVGFDTLTYRKHYDRSPIIVGHQETFSVAVAGECSVIGKEIFTLCCCFYFVVATLSPY